jgi:hypothetical protein
MLPVTRLYLIKLSHWTTTSGRKRTAKGDSMEARTTLNPFTRGTTPLRVVGMGTPTSMEDTSPMAMVATSMARGTMEDSGETTPMAIIMDITMGEMDIAVSTQMPRRISPTSHASSVRRLGTTPQAVHRIRQMKLPSPIHSRRDR